jgi:hypothetical protein
VVARQDHNHGSPPHGDTEHGAIHLNALAVNGALNMQNQLITNVATPVSVGDATNKSYVDNAVAGLSWKQAVRATDAPGSPVTLTGLSTLDGVVLAAGDRVLSRGWTGVNAAQNGIYVAAVGAWARAQDANSSTEIPGAAVFVEEGTLYADTAWVCTNNPGFVLGTDNMFWAQFAGGGTVTAGAGMTQSGNTLNVIAGDTSLLVNADELHVNTSVIASVASLASYVPTSRQVIAGAGLTGGGALSADATLNVIAGDSTIVVNADEIHVNPSVILPTAGTITQALVKTSATNYAVGWDSVLGPPLQPGNVDFNTLTQTGIYNISTPNTNAPPTSIGSSGVLIVTQPINGGGTYCSQIWQSEGTGGTSQGVWYRGQRASFWSPWVKLDAVVAGGAINQVLAKKSATDFDTQWVTPTVYATKFAAALAGTSSPEVVTHNLNTRDIQLTVLNGATPFTAVSVDWDATSVNTATIRYNPNLGAGYRVVVAG